MIKTSAFGHASAASIVFPKRGTNNSSVPKNNLVLPLEVPGDIKAAIEGVGLLE